MSDFDTPRMTRRDCLSLAVHAALATALPSAQAQQSDGRAARIVVPFGTGGAPDLVARLLAATLSANTGRAFVVENRAGANGIIGTDAVAKAAPDGNTWLLHGPSLAINPSMYRKLPFDAERDLRPVVEVCTADGVLLVVNARNPAESLADFVASAKKPGAAVAYSSPGVGNAFHLAAVNFLAVAGIQAVHVPYKGAGEAVTALLAGDVQFMIASTPSVGPNVKDGRLRALAFAGRRRSADFPAIPTLTELGVSGMELTLWYGLFAPRGTSDDVVSDMNKQVRAALADTQLRGLLSRQGLLPTGGESEQLAIKLHTDIAAYRDLAKRAGIVPE